MVNYKNGLIYKLCSKDLTDKNIYIGSTCNFNERKRGHKNDCNNNKKNHKKAYKYINEHGGFDEWEMIFIEYAPCESKMELNKIERDHQDKNENCTLNSYKAYITCDERKKNKYEQHKKYCQNNKEKLQEYHAKYFQLLQNKETAKEYQKIRYLEKKYGLI